VGESEGQPYCVLELVEGRGLDRQLAGAPQPPRQAAELARTLARAVHAVHQQGIVHRDLKPSNVLLQIATELTESPESPERKATNQASDAKDNRNRLGPPLSSFSEPSGPSMTHSIPKIADFGLAKFVAASPAEPALAAGAGDPGAGPGLTRAGHLLVVAGSVAMGGAAVLACHGALSAGVGLCTLLAPRAMIPRLAALPPEVMVQVSGEDRLEPVTGGLSRYTALAAGPGLGGGGDLDPTVARWLAHLWESTRLPLVFDADALPSALGGAPAARVITPHPGEAARRLGVTAAAVQADRFGAVARLATDGATALLKGRHTLVAAEGHPISVNPTNAAALATGGSGDVLTGVIGALLARGVGARDAARLGAYVHGAAGVRLALQGGDGWTASDIAVALKGAVVDLLGSQTVV
jgi:hydroxyethylthiazole kinase-like uncharacterized protein yjeF